MRLQKNAASGTAKDSPSAVRGKTSAGLLLGGRYLLDERICDGPASMIYRARDIQAGRTVAVKTPPEHRKDDRFVQDIFSLEADVLEAIDHHTVVSLLDRSADPPFLVMEYVEGRTLFHATDRIKDVEDVLLIALKICKALRAIHKLGVIHRDLKAENIVLLPGEPFRIKLLDFGCALAPPIVPVDPYSKKRYLGTLGLMPPEHSIFGRSSSDKRTDIYLLGMLLYELATNSLPFDTLMLDLNPSSYEYHTAVMRIQFFGEPEPPHNRNPSIPKDISNLIMRAINKSPKRRFQSADKMAEALSGSLIALHVRQLEQRA